MPSPALGPAVLRWGNDVESATLQYPEAWLNSLALTHIFASDLYWACQKYYCTVQFVSSSNQQYSPVKHFILHMGALWIILGRMSCSRGYELCFVSIFTLTFFISLKLLNHDSNDIRLRLIVFFSCHHLSKILRNTGVKNWSNKDILMNSNVQLNQPTVSLQWYFTFPLVRQPGLYHLSKLERSNYVLLWTEGSVCTHSNTITYPSLIW